MGFARSLRKTPLQRFHGIIIGSFLERENLVKSCPTQDFESKPPRG
jgi:hypothetical protein